MSNVALSQSEISQRINALGIWFQNMDLAGVPTAPNHPLGDYPAVKWRHIQNGIPLDLSGKSVLDVGCNAGFYSLEMKRRGASRVLGIDTDVNYLKQARLAAEISSLSIDFTQMSVYDVPLLKERFDIVLFMGVLYHLRHPLLALDLLYEHVVGDTLVFQSLMRGSNAIANLQEDYPFEEVDLFNQNGFPLMHFIERSYANDNTNWWIPNRACVESMLRSSGFLVVGQPEDEVYICTRRSQHG